MSGKTIVEKILSQASGLDARTGDRVWAKIDLSVIRDFGGPNAVLEFDEFTDNGKVWDPDRIAITFDYQAPAKVTKVANNQVLCRQFARRQGIRNLFDVNWGIGQHVLLEQGMVEPGSVIIGTDSHMNLLGAVGSFSTGVGNTDIVASWYAGKLWFRVPETIKVTFRGKYQPPVSAKDMTLKFISVIGTDKANYRSLEFYGQPIEELSLAGRLTLGSMVTEINAKICFMVPDGGVLQFLEERCRKKLNPVTADADAQYTDAVKIDLDRLEPMIACPHTPDNIKTVQEVAGTPFTQGFIGSCTNGRLEDLVAGAEVLKKAGRISSDVRLIVTPATREVARDALKAGLYEIFMDAGALVTNPGCSLCTIGHHGVLGEGDILLSSSNRNFRGKLGKGSQVYLCSPATVAASAVAGKITDPREFA